MEERDDVQINNTNTETNPIWDFFKVSNRQERLAKCNLCDVTLSYKSTTSNLCKHLYRKHTITIEDIIMSDLEDCDSSDLRIEVKNTIDRRKMLRSNIWKLFDVTNWTERMACCKMCHHEFSYKSSTSNLFRHVHRMHPDKCQYLKDDKDRGVTKGTYETANKAIKVRHRKSSCWRFFKIINQRQFLAKCKICALVLSYRATASNLNKHVHRKHRDLLNSDSYVIDDEECDEEADTEELKPLSNKARIKTSYAWDYFDAVDDEQTLRASCKLCSKVLNYSTTVSNLTKHLKKIHGLRPKDSTDAEDAPDAEDDGQKKSFDGVKRYHRSKAWKYFDIEDDDKKTARCKMCDTSCSYLSSVSNLMKHVQKKHSDYMQLTNESSDEDSLRWEPNEDKSETDSMVWLYFKCLDSRLRIASCLVCQKRIDYATLLDLQRHLIKKHPHIKLPEGQDTTSRHIISDDGQLYEIATKQEIGDENDPDDQNEAIEMDTVYLEDPIDEIYPQRKRKRIDTRQPKTMYRDKQESSDEESCKKLEKADSIDHFGTYIASLLKQLPKSRSDQLQISFIKQTMDAQLTTETITDISTNTRKMSSTHIPVTNNTDTLITSNTITDSDQRVTVDRNCNVEDDMETITECDTQIVVTSNTSNEYSIAVTKLPDLAYSDR